MFVSSCTIFYCRIPDIFIASFSTYNYVQTSRLHLQPRCLVSEVSLTIHVCWWGKLLTLAIKQLSTSFHWATTQTVRKDHKSTPGSLQMHLLQLNVTLKILGLTKLPFEDGHLMKMRSLLKEIQWEQGWQKEKNAIFLWSILNLTSDPFYLTSDTCIWPLTFYFIHSLSRMS